MDEWKDGWKGRKKGGRLEEREGGEGRRERGSEGGRYGGREGDMEGGSETGKQEANKGTRAWRWEAEAEREGVMTVGGREYRWKFLQTLRLVVGISTCTVDVATGVWYVIGGHRGHTYNPLSVVQSCESPQLGSMRSRCSSLHRRECSQPRPQ